GHHKEPFSFEENTSSKFITFMERALPSVFAPSRNTGISAHNVRLNKRLTWSLGVFAETDGFGDSASINGGPNITGRITGLPVWKENGSKLLHLGLSVSRKGVPGGMMRFRERPEAHLLPRFIDTGAMPADSALLYAAEVAVVDGPFSIQAEYAGASLDSAMLNDPGFSGGYVQASWFLTGEHRRYKQSSGVFDRIHPDRSFIKGGPGAWEVAVRYSMLDLNDQMVRGGQLEDFTLGVNWYLSASSRFMFNYVNASLTDIGVPDPGNLGAFMMRFQVDF
ncbi:MAG: OprO/OprP family phosphate-selective porin, partial [Acidobacteriota bacterium]